MSYVMMLNRYIVKLNTKAHLNKVSFFLWVKVNYWFVEAVCKTVAREVLVRFQLCPQIGGTRLIKGHTIT